MKDASISKLETEIRYLEGMLVKSKISLAQGKSELDVSVIDPERYRCFNLRRRPTIVLRLKLHLIWLLKETSQ